MEKIEQMWLVSSILLILFYLNVLRSSKYFSKLLCLAQNNKHKVIAKGSIPKSQYLNMSLQEKTLFP